MVIDHAALETMKAEANPAHPHGDAGAPRAISAAATAEPRATEEPASPNAADRIAAGSAPPGVEQRLRRLRVSLIAQLAARRMPLGRIRRISIGTILEFDRGIDEPLDLLANNQPIGRGEAVKVGENFGLRITEIRDADSPARPIQHGADG